MQYPGFRKYALLNVRYTFTYRDINLETATQ